VNFVPLNISKFHVLLVCVCFAECVDDGEITVVLSFADRPRDFVQPNAGRQLTTYMYWPAAV